MGKDKVNLTDKALNSIKDYLSKRFGCYGIRSFDFTCDEPSSSYNYDYAFKQPIKHQCMGIFRHALVSCVFYAKVYTIVKEKNEVGQRWVVNTGLSYFLKGGGNNGCELDFEFYINENGDIIEKYN